jgi:SAM-dependent methyltransferase
MKFPIFRRLVHRAGRPVSPLPMPGQFQRYSHTLPNRYPWIFEFAAQHLDAAAQLRLLSFGCSRGDEVFALQRYFPAAAIHGIDIDPRNIAQCTARAVGFRSARIRFTAAASTVAEADESYDAIFCLAVLCLGDLTASGARRCEPPLSFGRFSAVVADFARCLKPGGLLFLHTTNFRFGDTATSANFDVVLNAEPAQLASDVLFDRDNNLMEGVRYSPVCFRKRLPDRAS